MDYVLSPQFWGRVSADHDGCWRWLGPRNRDGYGATAVRTAAGWLRTGAHRVAWESFCGPIPSGLTLDHLCRNRACVNPRHLEPVTHCENILRGEGIAAQNARKTRCDRGHSRWRTVRFKSGRLAGRAMRVCIDCKTIWERARRARREAEQQFGL